MRRVANSRGVYSKFGFAGFPIARLYFPEAKSFEVEELRREIDLKQISERKRGKEEKRYLRNVCSIITNPNIDAE